MIPIILLGLGLTGVSIYIKYLAHQESEDGQYHDKKMKLLNDIVSLENLKGMEKLSDELFIVKYIAEKNDRALHIKNDRALHIKNDRALHIKNDRALHVNGIETNIIFTNPLLINFKASPDYKIDDIFDDRIDEKYGLNFEMQKYIYDKYGINVFLDNNHKGNFKVNCYELKKPLYFIGKMEKYIYIYYAIASDKYNLLDDINYDNNYDNNYDKKVAPTRNCFRYLTKFFY